MSKFDQAELFDKAAERHGHKCPSLYYGVKGAIMALEVAAQRNIKIKQVVVEGTSKCIRDGASTVLEAEAQLAPVIVQEGCAISVGDGEQNIQLRVKPEVREKVNSLNKQLALEEFQLQGLEYLQGLSEDDLFGVYPLETEQFRQLLTKGK